MGGKTGSILPQPGQLRPDSSNSYGLDALVSNLNNYSKNLLNLTQTGTNITLTGDQVIAGVVQLVGTASADFTVTLPPTPRIIDALGPTIAKNGSYGVEISVQNEDPTYVATLTVNDSLTTIHGTATVDPGTRRIWLLTVGTPYDPTVVSIQDIGTFSIAGGAPGTGTVTSVGLTMPAEFAVAGSPVTTAGVLGVTKANENANTFWAGPTSGSPAQPTFRAITTTDLPGSGFVTSVALTAPGEFVVGGSPVTGSGTLALTKAAEAANTVWAGPTSGAGAQPTFRALVQADLPASLSLSQSFATVANETATLANSRRIVAGSNITITDGGAGSTLTIASTAAGGGGTLQSQVFTSSGTFTIPTGVTAVWLTMIGGGGAGCQCNSTHGGGGGGAGELCEMFQIPISGATCAVTVGAGGTGAATTPGASGGNSSFNNNTFTFTVLGGSGGGGTSSEQSPGPGGGAGHGITSGVLGTAESPAHFGGGAGGGGGSVATPFQAGSAGAGAPGFLSGGAGGTTNGSTGNGGGGGAATIWGIGGAGGNAGSVGANASATSYGSGGGGAGMNVSALAGGSGAGGRVEVYWIG